MKIVVIMGRTSSGKSTVEKELEQIGFKRSISYTTRKPSIKNGKQEEQGVDYHFVSEDKFMQLVENGAIIEYERYKGNLYGTPRPFGSKRFVVVLCIKGYKAMKEIFGDQVLGIYLKCNSDVAESRAVERDGDTRLVSSRKEDDEKLILEMEQSADVIIDGNQYINAVLADILKALRDRDI